MRTAILSGRLGRDPELHSPQNSEYSVLNFSVANDDESRKTQSGEYENVTSWFDISFWTKKPQDWLRRLHKGDLVIVECDAKQETWEKDGEKRSRIKFTVKRGSFPYVVPKQGGGSNDTAPDTDPSSSSGYSDDYPDGIPF